MLEKYEGCVRVNLFIPKGAHKAIKQIALSDERSMQSTAIRLLEEIVAQKLPSFKPTTTPAGAGLNITGVSAIGGSGASVKAGGRNFRKVVNPGTPNEFVFDADETYFDYIKRGKAAADAATLVAKDCRVNGVPGWSAPQ